MENLLKEQAKMPIPSSAATAVMLPILIPFHSLFFVTDGFNIMTMRSFTSVFPEKV